MESSAQLIAYEILYESLRALTSLSHAQSIAGFNARLGGDLKTGDPGDKRLEIALTGAVRRTPPMEMLHCCTK